MFGSFDGHRDGARRNNLEAFADKFVDAIAEHRHWERDPKEVPA